MTKVISINGSRFALPEGMTAKDIQALAGFLVTLTPVSQEYDYDASDYLSFLTGQGTEVRVDTIELLSKAAAKQQHEESLARYRAKRDAEKQDA
jgi:hypothetical protein